MTVVQIGSLEFDHPVVVVVDPPTRRWPELRPLMATAAAVHEVTGRPTPSDAHAIRAHILDTGAQTLVSVGAGLVVDASKLSVYEHRSDTGRLLEHIAVPCGP